MVEAITSDRELVLAPGMFAFVLDRTKGKVAVHVGPEKTSLSQTDNLVRWDPRTSRYTETQNVDAELQSFAVAEQGQYIVLSNPADPTRETAHPPMGTNSDAVELQVGRRLVIAGPASFPLWPGQTAETIDGHHLRHNQYLIARVYDDQLATASQGDAVVAPQTRTDGSDGGDGGDTAPEVSVAPPSGTRYTMGQLIVVPGTDVSFYIPPSGMEVVAEGDSTVSNARRLQQDSADPDRYVRNAVTLETLEYCILLDEGGEKRYVRGPDVVFPSPTETFLVNENGSRVFDAIELNEQSGLYVKVIEAYEENGRSFAVGEELFITGAEQAIYFPRAEHSIIMYGDKRKHHAIAVPAGEGRYVLDRTSGRVELRVGPTMLLPDPRTEVIVRRILDPHDVETMYPGNDEALAVNVDYAAQRQSASDYLENAEMRKGAAVAAYASMDVAGATRSMVGQNVGSTPTPGQHFHGDAIGRGTSYTQPRTITLDTKYEGAVAISIFPGYAVLITDKIGNRRVAVGPVVELLQYDETIMALSLSTGRPKSDDDLLRTGYLRVINNVVTDRVSVETKDLVAIDVEVSYRVNFVGETEEERERWFSVENYVQVLTDHARSRLRNAAKRSDVLDFYTNAIDIVRDAVLGTVPTDGDRPGLTFDENSMHVYDVEVLSVTLKDDEVAKLLVGAQTEALKGAIQLTITSEGTEREKKLQGLRRDVGLAIQDTASLESRLAAERAQWAVNVRLAEADGTLEVRTREAAVETVEREAVRLDTEQGLAFETSRDAIALARLRGETAELVSRLNAFQPGLIEAMTSFSKESLVEHIVTALGPAALAAGVTTSDMLGQVFGGTPLEGVFNALNTRPVAIDQGR